MPISFVLLLVRHWREKAGESRSVPFLLALSLMIGAWSVSSPSVLADVPAGVLYVCDSTDDRVLALRDVDDSGAVEAALDSITVFYDDSSPGPDLSIPSHLWVDDDGTLYVLDGGTLDMILALGDVTGDGDANDDGEVHVFYDSATSAIPLRTPNTLIRGPGGAFYVVDDSAVAPRIVKLQDKDGNRDAMGDGEASVVYDSSALSLVGPQDMESLAFDAEGRAYVGDSETGAVFRMTDENGDGTFLDADEVQLFFQSTDAFPLTDVDCLAVVDSDVYACDEDKGVVLQLRDADVNHSVDPTAGEATIFLDGTLTADTNDFLRLPTGTFLVLDGAEDTIFAATDLDGDGQARGVAEIVRWLVDDGTSLSTPSGLAFAPDPSDDVFVFVRGNAVDDDVLNVTDPIFVLEYLFIGARYEGCVDVLDVDDNGRLNITDPVYLLNFLFAGGNPPPAPFPAVGPDPTEDAWECAPSQ